MIYIYMESVKRVSPSVMPDSATPWTIACQAPLSIGFSKQEYRNGLSFPPPGDLPNPGIKPTSSVFPALARGFFTTAPLWNTMNIPII